MGDDMFASMSMLNSSIQNAGASFLTARANKKDREFAREMYERQVSDARTNWMMQNEYNTPAAQMQRLADAQVNPAVYWSKGVGDSGNAAEPEAATPLMSETRLPPGMNYISPFEQLSAILAAEKTKAEISKIGGETKNIEQATVNLQLDSVKKDFENRINAIYGDERASREVKLLLSQFEKNMSEALTSDRLGQVYYFEQLIDSEKYDILREQHPSLVEDAKKAVELKKQEIQTSKSQEAKNYADKSASEAQASYYKISAKDTQASMMQKIDESIELYLDEHGDIQVDAEKLKEVKRLALKQAQNVVRQQGSDYWNPFKYVGQLLGGTGSQIAKSVLK